MCTTMNKQRLNVVALHCMWRPREPFKALDVVEFVRLFGSIDNNKATIICVSANK